MILADDMGTNEIGCYGGTNISTPNIDRLAHEGVRMTNNYASMSMSVPIRASLYTGLYPTHHGSYQNHKATYSHVKSAPHYLTDLVYRQGAAVHIAFGALDEGNLHLGRERLSNRIKVHSTVSEQIDLLILYAEVLQRAVAGLAHDADNLLEGVVRLAGNRQHDITGTEQPEQTDGQGLRAVDASAPNTRA